MITSIITGKTVSEKRFKPFPRDISKETLAVTAYQLLYRKFVYTVESL